MSSVNIFKKYLIELIGLIELICLAIIIMLIGLEVIPLKFPVESAKIIGVPMLITYITTYLMIFVHGVIFNYYMVNDLRINDKKGKLILTRVASNQVTGIIQALKRFKETADDISTPYRYIGVFVALVGLSFAIGIGFDISPTTVPGLLSIKGEKFYADPLTPCNTGDAGCPQSFQSKFRFQWVKEVSDVMINGISKKLSLNWGDVSDGRVVMVATTDNDTNINYRWVEDENKVPVFCLITKCDTINNNNEIFRNLTIQKPTPILEVIKDDLWLENRWLAEVINIQQDIRNETTQITVNLVQISSIDSPCDGERPNITEKLQLCRPTKGVQIFCLMNTYVPHTNSIRAGCDSLICNTAGLDNIREEYTSPKPVYGDYMHKALATYGGHILIPECSDDSVGGCLTHDTNSVDEVKDRFVEFVRGITTSGVLSRRISLSNMGIEIPVQILVKGATGVRLEFGKIYWITILIMSILCLIFIVLLYFKDPNSFYYEVYQYYNSMKSVPTIRLMTSDF